jgi:hypothetical protein
VRRIRITLIEKKRGWSYVRQEWDTQVNGGFYGGKSSIQSTKTYASPSDILEVLATEQDADDRQTGNK